MNAKLFRSVVIAAVVLGGWLVCSTTATAAHAKSRAAARSGRAQVEKHAGKVAQELNLTKDQKQQLKPILQEEARKLKALRTETGLSGRQKRQKLQEIRQDMVAKVKPILTPEQLEKWQKLRQQTHAKHRAKS